MQDDIWCHCVACEVVGMGTGTIIVVSNNSCDIRSLEQDKMNKYRYTYHKWKDALMLILYHV